VTDEELESVEDTDGRSAERLTVISNPRTVKPRNHDSLFIIPVGKILNKDSLKDSPTNNGVTPHKLSKINFKNNKNYNRSMTQLYLIRHGIAADRHPQEYPNDGQRPLTEAGVKKTRKIAKRLAQLGLQFNYLLTSPLIRAQQTAEILVNAKLSTKPEISTPLAPTGELQDWLDWYNAIPKTGKNGDVAIAVVGHQPDLGHWAEQLIWGESRGQLIVKKAGIIGVNLPDEGESIGQSQLFWLVPPRLLL
jgi:phosphohistidine phosphatase